MQKVDNTEPAANDALIIARTGRTIDIIVTVMLAISIFSGLVS